jgi:hypothetical protein
MWRPPSSASMWWPPLGSGGRRMCRWHGDYPGHQFSQAGGGSPMLGVLAVCLGTEICEDVKMR